MISVSKNWASYANFPMSTKGKNPRSSHRIRYAVGGRVNGSCALGLPQVAKYTFCILVCVSGLVGWGVCKSFSYKTQLEWRLSWFCGCFGVVAIELLEQQKTKFSKYFVFLSNCCCFWEKHILCSDPLWTVWNADDLSAQILGTWHNEWQSQYCIV